MAAAARLERLCKLIQADLDVLPERPASPIDDDDDDDDPTGGVSLNPEGGQPKQTEFVKPTTPEPAKPSRDKSSAEAAASVEENGERRFVWVQGAATSYNSGAMPKRSALPTTPLPPTNLQKGDLPLPGQNYFTSIVALSKYPYKFCNKKWMQDIASAFFDAGKFWEREWDLYYVWDIDEPKPLILVTERQVEDLLNEINSALKLGLRITNEQREDGLVARFPDHPRCLPRYLGRSRSKEQYGTMASNVPPAAAAAPVAGRTLQDFKQLMEDMWDLQKAKNKAQKEKKAAQRLVTQKGISDQFKRAQRYLGLRPSAGLASGLPTAVDYTQPAPFPFDKSVVFICVDVEAYERANHLITEVGVATLDTRDLAGLAPGEHGESWRSKIKARHFRIQEHAHYVNSAFVSGCPDKFDFGTSEFVRLKDAPAAVEACFRPPFCARLEGVDGLVAMANMLDLGEQRNLIFLGHDALTDVKYLQKLGFDPLTLPNLLESQDTAAMYRVWRREQQITKLGNILYDFDIAGFNLHNAGNDAVFTVQAMLGICVREASIRGTSEMKDLRASEKAAKLAAAEKEAKARAEEEAAGWSDDGDGGGPVPIVINPTAATRVLPARPTNPPAADVRENGQNGYGSASPGNGRTRGVSTHGYATSTGSYRGNGHRGGNESPFSPRGDSHHQGRGPRGRTRSSDLGRAQRGGRGRGRSRGGGRGLSPVDQDSANDTGVRFN